MNTYTDINIYTDGSSSKNGTPQCVAGWSYCIPDFNGLQVVRYGNLAPPSSNNRGEMMGVILAAEMFSKTKDFRAIIHSDSQYVVKSCNEWHHKWALSDYDGVKNLDLLLPLLDIIKHSVNRPILNWVRGHNGDRGNELADQYAGYGKKNINQVVESATQSIMVVTEQEAMNYINNWKR